MNDQDIQNFRTRVSQDPALQAQFFDAWQDSCGALASLARQNGFDATTDGVLAAITKVSDSGELTDFELELVSGGGGVPCKAETPPTDSNLRAPVVGETP